MNQPVVSGIDFYLPDHENIHCNDEDKEDEHPEAGFKSGRGIIESVQQDGNDIPENDMETGFARRAVSRIDLGGAVAGTHENRESHVGRDCQHGTHRQDAGAEGKNIEDIFHRCKTQGCKDRVDDGVEAEIEFRIVPGSLIAEEIFEEFLPDRNDKETVDHDIGRRAFLQEMKRDPGKELLGEHRREGSCDAEKEKLHQKSRRFLLNLIFFPDDVHQNE